MNRLIPMKFRLRIALAFLSLCLAGGQLAAAEPECAPEEVLPDNLFPSVRLETSMGDIIVELDRKRAPITANNFLRYVLAKQYDGTIFHRVMPGFVVQGGGYDEQFNERELFPPIYNESGNGLKNRPMTLSMARFDDPHSATSQFFINLEYNESLDPNSRSWGYAVFGTVISGQDTVEAIAAVETGYSEGLDAEDVPVTTVRLVSATVLEEPH